MPMKFVDASSQSPRSWILRDVRCCCDNTSEPSAALGSSLMLKSGTDVVIGEGGSKAAISTNWPATTLSTIELEMVDQPYSYPAATLRRPTSALELEWLQLPGGPDDPSLVQGLRRSKLTCCQQCSRRAATAARTEPDEDDHQNHSHGMKGMEHEALSG